MPAVVGCPGPEQATDDGRIPTDPPWTAGGGKTRNRQRRPDARTRHTSGKDVQILPRSCPPPGGPQFQGRPSDRLANAGQLPSRRRAVVARRRRVSTASARLKADGDVNRIMLLLTAKAAREIVEAFKANTEALKRIEGKIDGQTEIIKGITREAREMKDTLKGIKRKADDTEDE